jgi:hypothetical protein
MGLQASIVAQLEEDCSLILDGPAGGITEVEGAQLNDTVRTLGGIVNATHGRMVLAMCRVIATGWWDGGGILSAKQWLAMHWATTDANVTRVIAVAKKAEAYPEVVEALIAGEMTLEAAQLICRRVPTEFQSTFVDYARHMTMGQLRTCTRAVPTPSTKPDPKISDGADDKSPGEGGDPEDGDDPEQKQPVTDDRPPHVSFRRQEDGRWTLNANLSPEQGALVETALQEARDRAFLAAEDPDERLRLTWADSFIDLARRSLAHADAAGAEGTSTERTLVHLHYELGRLYPEGSDQPLPDAVARQILCDTNLVTVGFKDGRPVDIGRKTRVIPNGLRRIVLRRDGGCVVPGCGATRGLEIHHRIHWEDGGPTDASNLLALCKAHHRAHHHGLLNLHGDPYNGLTFSNACGKPICAHPPLTPGCTTTDALSSTAQTHGMINPNSQRLGPVGTPLQRWSIVPGSKPVPPRVPDLHPIKPHPPSPHASPRLPQTQPDSFESDHQQPASTRFGADAAPRHGPTANNG